MMTCDSHSITCSYPELAHVDGPRWERLTQGLSFHASTHGVTIIMLGQQTQNELWDYIQSTWPKVDPEEDEE